MKLKMEKINQMNFCYKIDYKLLMINRLKLIKKLIENFIMNILLSMNKTNN